MSRRLLLHDDAERELGDAADWYDTQVPGLGLGLIEEVDQAIESILNRPEAWPVWVGDRPYRKRALRRFPFVVFYEITAGGDVYVLAVAHARRRPGYWLERGSR